MNFVLIGLVVLVAALVAWLILQSSQGQKKNETLETQMSELRRDMETMATANAQNTGQVKAIGEAVSQRLEGVTIALQDGIKNSAQISGQITSQAQTVMAEELKNTREQIGQIQKQLGAVQQAGQQMSQTAQTLENILGGARSRGSFGEVTLERLLEDSLPSSQYTMQYRFTTGEIADAVIMLRDKKLMAIDSNFLSMPFAALLRKVKTRVVRLLRPSKDTLTPSPENILSRTKARSTWPSCSFLPRAYITSC